MVKKFKTLEEARRDLWEFNPDDKYYERVDKFFAMARKLVNRKYPPGLYKYKTIEEAQRHRKEMEEAARGK